MPLLRKQGLRLNMYARIGLLLVAAVSIPTIMLGYMSFYKSGEQIEAVTNAFMTDSLAYNALRIEALLDGVQRQSEKAIQSSELKQLLKEPPPDSLLGEFDFIRRINPLVGELKNNYELTVYPKQPAYYPNYAGTVDGSEPWFRKALAMDGQGFWELIAAEGADGKPADVMYVRAIRDFPYLQPLGVLTVRVPGYFFANELIVPERVNGLGFTLLQQPGAVIAMKSNGAASGCRPLVGMDGKEAAGGRLSEADCYEAEKTVGKVGWRLEATVPTDELMGPVRNMKEFTWLLVAASLAVMCLLLLLILRKVTVPIKLLVRHMRHKPDSEPVYFESYKQRGDEIGQLVRGYNAMVTGMLELLQHTRQMEVEKGRLEMRTLINQMNPHFLYNTMDSIKWSAERAGVRPIVEMVASLSNLLRFSINNGEELTTVERELEHVKNYLTIEQLRHQDTFSVYFQVQPNILQLPFMKLTVQPIVENAVKHAMKKLPDESIGRMIVSLYRTDTCLVCCVEDNGPGIDAGASERFSRGHLQGEGEGGVGLYNTDRRLKLKFGEAYGITLENRAEGGCRVTLRHPVVGHDEAGFGYGADAAT